jgi:GntR family transcriptional regulator / MocR family aminotransferase
MSGTTERTADLLLAVDRRRGSVVSSLQGALRAAIHAGRLREGEALPPTRRLAAELGVARATVVEAYARLSAEGFVTAHAGSATRVAVGAGSEAVTADAGAMPIARFDLRPGGPDVRLFPHEAWARIVARVVRDAPEALAYGDPSGVPALRTALAAYLGRTRAVATTPDGIVITGGVTQGLTLLCRALARRGDRTLAVEDPGPNPIERQSIRHAGLEPLPIPVDDAGIDVGALERSGATAVLVTPAHQYPTGSVLGAERRRALVRWARSDRRLIIEDDYAEFRYDRLAVAALQGLAPRRVAYLGSASKLLAPGLRLGWLVTPDWVRVAVAEEKQYDDYGSPSLGQLALAAMIDEGTLGRHVRRARVAYRRRRDATLLAIARHLPGWQARGVAAGLQVLVQPPSHLAGTTDERAIVVRAFRAGIWITGLASFHHLPATEADPDRQPGLVIGYAMVAEQEIDAGIAALASIIREVGREPAPSVPDTKERRPRGRRSSVASERRPIAPIRQPG